MLTAEFVDTRRFFDREHLKSLIGDSSWLVVALTGTLQKVENMIDVLLSVKDTSGEELSFCAWNVECNTEELNGITGADIAAKKARDYARKVVWPIVEKSDQEHKDLLLRGKIFVTSDTKMSISTVGGTKSEPVHKLRTTLQDEGYTLNESKLNVSWNFRGETIVMDLVEFLPLWWADKFDIALNLYIKDEQWNDVKMSSDGVIRWSTGNAAFKFLSTEDSDYDGSIALAYGDSNASIILPESLASDPVFWRDYLIRSMANRNGSMKAILGSSFGILVEEIVGMVKDGDVDEQISLEYLNILLPQWENSNIFDLLVQHAKGAPVDNLMGVIGKVISMSKAEERRISTRKPSKKRPRI